MNRHLAAGVVAGVVAPSAIMLGFDLWQVLAGGSDDGRSGWTTAGRIYFALVLMSYALPPVLLYGLPMFLLLRRFQAANIYTCVLTALAPIGIATELGWTRGASQKAILYGALFLISALAFWVFARKSIVKVHHA